MTEVHGDVASGFEKVRDAFAASFEKGEVGAAVAVFVDGEPVVDLWGGWADAGRIRAWERDTIVNTYSTTKGMTATCAHRLIERGLLDIDAPVARYWPEFAQAGKERVPVRFLLNHSVGLHQLSEPLPPELANDWKAVTTALAAQAPAWEPGTRQMYHAVTFGYLVGELVRRIDGRSLGTYFRQEVADPLGADFLIGFGPEHDSRCADIVPAQIPPEWRERMDAMRREQAAQGEGSRPAMDPSAMTRSVNTRAWRAAEIPAANGHGTAMGVAKVYGALARGGELAAVRVLEADTIDRAIVQQGPGTEPVRGPSTGPGGFSLKFGHGFMLLGSMAPGMPQGRQFGHPGAGGSIGLADPDRKLAFGYVMNQMQMGMTGGAHGWALLQAAYACMG